MNTKLTVKRLFAGLLMASVVGTTVFFETPKAQAVDYNNLCEDGAFVARTLDTNGVQNFLRSKGSYLASYSENGKSAAQMIAEAATSNGVNAYAVLAMLQKEQGLITGSSSRAFHQGAYDWAMGYGATDSGTIDKYKGFGNQINYGVWQLKQNFDVWAANGSKWNVGRTMVIDGTTVRFSNRCTSAQYRYTPHLGTNFNYYFNLWNTASASTGSFDAQYVTQGPRTGYGAPGVNLTPNRRFAIWVNYRNTGGTTWYKAGKNMVRLGTSDPEDRGSAFANFRNVRGSLVQSAVRPGQTGTFMLWLTAPAQGGTYTEKFRLVAEGVKWMGEEAVYTFNVIGPGAPAGTSVSGDAGSAATYQADAYNAQLSAQGPRSGVGSNNSTLLRNQKATLWINYVNTGTQTWTKTGYNAVHLGAWEPMDRNSPFSGLRRGYLVQNSVAPGQVGTFILPITAPATAGQYTETYRPVAEHISWMGDTVQYHYTVR